MRSILKQLVEIPAPSGYEDRLRDAVRDEVEPLAEEVKKDALGNLLVRFHAPDQDASKLMLVAHLDEIGLIATHIDKNGYVRFTNMGGVYPHYLLGGRVRFLDGTRGVVDADGGGRRKKVPAISEMYIDVGASDSQSCSVKVGDVAIFERSWLDLGDRVVSKALDDRVGVAILIETLRSIASDPRGIQHELWFVFSAQEEVRLRGAGPAAFQVKPDIALAVDVTRTGDTPQGQKMEVALGSGPAVKIRDQRMLSHPGVVEWMLSVARDKDISIQREVLKRGTTDASSIQITGEGVPSGCLSIPCRYVHSPSEMVDWGDVQAAVRFLHALAKSPVPF